MKTTKTANWLAATCLLATHAASAETWYLKAAENSGNLTTPSHWTNSLGTAASAFSSDDTYVVAPNKACKTPNSATTIGLDGELRLGTGSKYGQLNIYCTPLSFAPLTLDYGTLAMQGVGGGSMSIDGEIAVIGASNVMRWLYSRQTMTFDAKLKGASTAVLSTHVRYANEGSRRDRDETLVLAGDCSEYEGSISVKVGVSVSSVTLANTEWFAKLVLATENFSMPGKIIVADRCALEVTANAAAVGSLTLNSGSILTVPAATAGGLSVSGTLEFTPPQRLRMAHHAPNDGLAHTIDVLTAPAGMALDPADFALEGDDADMRFAILGVRTEGGRQTLTVSYEPVVELTTSDSSSLARASGNDTDSIAWGLGSSWSNGEAPAAGTNYVVRMIDDKAMYLRTPTLNANLKFPGKSLTVGSNGFLRIYQSGGYALTINDLRLMDGAELDVGQSTYANLYGSILAVAGEVRFGTCNQTLSIYATLNGSGDIWFSGPSSGTSTPQGTFNLRADSPAFKGRMRVEYCQSGATYDSKRESITADSELQFGGRLDEFDPKALTLRKFGRLTTRGSFSLTTNYNRGVFVDGSQGGVFNVGADNVLTLDTQLTLNGKLYKDGAGTLAMGGTVKFGADSLDAPTEDANIFIVTNGTVKVTAADAMNGLATSFADGTLLVLAVDPGDADLTRYGIRNVKTSTPFTAVSGTLPLSLEADAAAKSAAKNRAFTLGLLTVANVATNAVKAMLPEVVSPFPSTRGTLVEIVDAENGWTTYALDVKPRGLRILFR